MMRSHILEEPVGGDKVFLLSPNAGRDDPRGPLILLPAELRACR